MENKAVGRLMERYKKSQQLLENVGQQSPINSPFSYHESGFVSTSNRKAKKMFDDGYDSSSRERRKYKQSLDQISQLKDTLSVRELQDKEKNNRIKLLNQQLKQTLREYMERTKELEKKMIQKEQQIKGLEDENKHLQENHSKQQINLKEAKLKEDGQSKILEEIKNNYHLIRSKLVNKKEKMQSLKEQLQIQQQQYDEQGFKFGKELERLQKLCEDFSNEIKEQEQKNSLLEQEVQELGQSLNQKDDNIRYLELTIQEFRQRDQDMIGTIEQEKEQNNNLKNHKLLVEQQNDQLKSEITSLQKQLNQQQEQVKKEIQALNSQYENDTKKYKEKALKAKQLIQQKDGSINELKSQISQFQKDMEIFNFQKEQQQKEFDLLQNQCKHLDTNLKELQLSYQQSQDSLYVYYQEIEKYKSQIIQYEDQQMMDIRELNNLNEIIRKMEDQKKQLEMYIYKLENEIESLKNEQGSVLDSFEQKVDLLILENNQKKLEIVTYQQKESELKKKAKDSEEEVCKLKKKLENKKIQVESLLVKQKQLEDRIKDIENLKMKEQIEERKVKMLSQQNENSNKLKALDEIQQMINNHKIRK